MLAWFCAVVFAGIHSKSVKGAPRSKPFFNSLALGKCGSDFTSTIFKLIIQNSSQCTRGKSLPVGGHIISEMKSHPWFRWWLSVVRQQAIAPANVDRYLCGRVVYASGYNELKIKIKHTLHLELISTMFPITRPRGYSMKCLLWVFGRRPTGTIQWLECATCYHHPRRQQCVMSRNLIIFKVATWHYRWRQHIKNNCILHNLLC